MAEHRTESNSSSSSFASYLLEKQCCKAGYVSFVSVRVCLHSATPEKCTAQILFSSMIFQEDCRSKKRMKK